MILMPAHNGFRVAARVFLHYRRALNLETFGAANVRRPFRDIGIAKRPGQNIVSIMGHRRFDIGRVPVRLGTASVGPRRYASLILTIQHLTRVLGNNRNLIQIKKRAWGYGEPSSLKVNRLEFARADRSSKTLSCIRTFQNAPRPKASWFHELTLLSSEVR